MPTDNQLVYELRLRLIMMRPEDRKKLFRCISEGYCKDCGGTLEIDQTCYCERDE